MTMRFKQFFCETLNCIRTQARWKADVYSPLYRLAQDFGRQGLKLSQQAIANWLLNISEKWL